MSVIGLLGPQRFVPTLPYILDRLGVRGPLALVTAGWREREDEDEDLREACGGRRCYNLSLFARWERVRQQDPVLGAAHREKQDKLRRLQGLYRVRLEHAMAALQAVAELAPDEAGLRDAEVEDALAVLRALDVRQLERTQCLHDVFDREVKPRSCEVLQRHRRDIRRIIGACDALLIAGGHVAVLLNRLRLFGVAEALDGQRVVAWSAGAMSLCEQVVLFHDTPPQGAGQVEVFGRGLGLVPGLLVFPHARRRLRLHDTSRVARLARRFAPLICVTLDEQCDILLKGGQRTYSVGAQRFHHNGELSALAVSP